jgi:hypothetical protein
MHSDQSANDFQVTEFFCAYIKQKIAPTQIINAVPSLDGVLHSGCKFSICTTELLEEHPSELHVRLANIDGVHQLLNMVVHKHLQKMIYVLRTPCVMQTNRQCVRDMEGLDDKSPKFIRMARWSSVPTTTEFETASDD